MEGVRSNENLLGDFQISEFDSFVFGTPDDTPQNDVVWEGLDSFSYEHFLFDLLETNKSLLQPKASNDCLEAEKEDKMFEEKEIDEVMHRQENDFEEDSINNQEEEKDLHIFQPPTNLFHCLLFQESMQQFAEEKSHGKPKNRRTQGMEKIVDIPSIFSKDNIDSRNVEENLESIFIFPPLHSFSIHELKITLAMLLTCVQNILPFYQELIRKGSYLFSL